MRLRYGEFLRESSQVFVRIFEAEAGEKLGCQLGVFRGLCEIGKLGKLKVFLPALFFGFLRFYGYIVIFNEIFGIDVLSVHSCCDKVQVI